MYQFFEQSLCHSALAQFLDAFPHFVHQVVDVFFPLLRNEMVVGKILGIVSCLVFDPTVKNASDRSILFQFVGYAPYLFVQRLFAIYRKWMIVGKIGFPAATGPIFRFGSQKSMSHGFSVFAQKNRFMRGVTMMSPPSLCISA